MNNRNEEKNLNIKLSKNIDSLEFERIIKEYYFKSKLKKHDTIIFNFKYVEFCGLLELSQISLWIYSLELKSKQIKFVHPDDLEFYRFLYNYEFINFLVSKGIIGEQTKYRKPFAPYSSPMFPLKFQDNIEFQELLNDLNKPGRLELILNDIKDSELVKNNVIHSIILKEIGDNIFIHSKSKSSNIIMTKLKKLSSLNCAEFEAPFLNKLRGREVLNIVISDSGEGLYKTLLTAYKEDLILPRHSKKKNPLETDIIKYAFFKHSTSRTDEERKKDLIKYIKSTSLAYPLPTGLYKVKSIVRQYNGLLYIRSGKSIVCYDYLSEIGKEKVFSNETDKRFKDLTPFPGTQFKFYFPIQNIVEKFHGFYTSTSEQIEDSKFTLLDFISINEYIDESFNENENLESIQNILDEIESAKLRNKNNCGGIVFDVANFKFVKNKNIKHLIVSSAMASQTSNLCFILVNLEKKLIEEFHEDYSDDSFFDYFLPLLAYDNLYKPRVIGLETSYLKDIVESFRNLKVETDKDSYYNKCKHILNFDDSLTVNFNTNDLLHFYRKNLSDNIKNKILSDKYNIYYPNKKVLVPNKYYCTGFFELANLYDSQLLLNEITTWITISLQLEKPDCIITIGDNAKSIIDLIYDNFENQEVRISAKKHNINTSNIYMSTYHLQDKISPDDSIVIFTDVIGSAATLINSILELNRNNIKKILTIVNATPENTLFVNKIQFPIDCIVEKHISYFTSMPKNWDYSEVKIFNLKSNHLLESSSLPEGPLWIKLDHKKARDENGQFTIKTNPFLEDLIYTEKSYFSGHFESRNNHLVYLFNISSIINEYSKEISESIISHINDIAPILDCYQENIGFENVFSYLLYPTFNPGLDNVAALIAKKIPSLLLLPVDGNDLKNGLPAKYNFLNKSIILIDDAFVTGTTIEKMIDIASERGAKDIFSFVLLKRGNDYQGRRFEKIKQYGDSTVHSRYLVDAEIPIFSKDNCPICKKVFEYNSIIYQISDTEAFKEFQEFIGKLTDQFTTRSVGHFFTEREYFLNHSYKLHDQKEIPRKTSLERPYFSRLNLRWKLEVALNNVSMRKNIVEIIKRTDDYKQTIILIIQILSEEKYYFIKNSENFENLFYNQFISALVSSCKILLNDLKSLKYEEIVSIIDIIISFEESYFLENLQNFLCESQHDENKFYAIILGIFISNISKGSPLRIVRYLDEVKLKVENQKLSRIIDNLITYFKNRQIQILDNIYITINIHKESMVLLHNINHAIDSIEHYLEHDNIDEDAFKINYNVFIEEVDSFLEKINIFLNNLQTETSYNLIKDIVSKVEISLEEIKFLNSNKSFDQNIPANKILFERIKSFLCQRGKQESMPSALDAFEVDIKKICFETLQQERKKFESKDIKYDFFFPDTPCVTFGEEKHLILIFRNLIENIHRHSGGSKCVIYAFINYDNNKLIILFIDDGKKSQNIEFNEGLMSVHRSVNICRGSFNISDINSTQYSESIHEQFPDISEGIVAEVTLWLLTKELKTKS